MAGQQVPRVLVGDGERIAVDPIARPELAVPIENPEPLVAIVDLAQRLVIVLAPAAPVRAPPRACQ